MERRILDSFEFAKPILNETRLVFRIEVNSVKRFIILEEKTGRALNRVKVHHTVARLQLTRNIGWGDEHRTETVDHEPIVDGPVRHVTRKPGNIHESLFVALLIIANVHCRIADVQRQTIKGAHSRVGRAEKVCQMVRNPDEVVQRSAMSLPITV